MKMCVYVCALCFACRCHVGRRGRIELVEIVAGGVHKGLPVIQEIKIS